MWGKPGGSGSYAYGARFTPTRVGKTSACSLGARCLPVHPHACGENVFRRAPKPAQHGSPPRVWGKLAPLIPIRLAGRFTPTRVGKTGTPGAPATTPAVHPHACGENAPDVGSSSAHDGSPPRVWGKHPAFPWIPLELGSPPRVWGKLHVPEGQGALHRFTPTRVGKTHNVATLHRGKSVHPHACGENARPAGVVGGTVGSPPRVWGKPGGRRTEKRRYRFTPTRVGKTPPPAPAAPGAPVHPHACGENTFCRSLKCDNAGSPPRVWGKPYLTKKCRLCPRFTPTRVGKTFRRTARRSARSVHPHACGENDTGKNPLDVLPGSPPRVWGKHMTIYRAPDRTRFTPTRVGKTCQRGDAGNLRAVHPHACGENV